MRIIRIVVILLAALAIIIPQLASANTINTETNIKSTFSYISKLLTPEIVEAKEGLQAVEEQKEIEKTPEEIKNEVPGVKVERVGEGIVIEFESNVLFGFDKSNLTSEAKENLGKLVTILNKYPDTDIEIHGHTDSKGSTAYNQTLSEQRARAVSNYLVNQNIASKRLTTIGFGETRPKYSNDTEDGLASNRRVEFAITANEKMKQEAQ